MTIPITQQALEHWEEFFIKRGVEIPIFQLAEIVVLEALGLDWFDRFERYLTERKDLRELPGDLADRERAVSRVRIGHMIYLLQSCDGFVDRIEEFRTAEIEASFFELNFASLFVQNGYTVRFVKPSGRKQEDYDFDVLVDHKWIAVEAKTRRNGPLKDANTIRNALKKARSQLPVDRPGVIGISIASEYEGHNLGEHAIQVIEQEIHEFLHKTSRVNKVIVFRHTWGGQPPACRTNVNEIGKCVHCKSIPARKWTDRQFLISDVSELEQRGTGTAFPSFAPKYGYLLGRTNPP
ncbi:MAG TPA: hypothetical protein VNZ27_03250 [Rhodanobacter sp.]|jgi:hypothetical protein|nr:hypothetical protein [Rhodanobacter sp.]